MVGLFFVFFFGLTGCGGSGASSTQTNTLLSMYAGTYAGTWTATAGRIDDGYFEISIDSNGAITGARSSSIYRGVDFGSGKVDSSGNTSITFGSASNNTIFTGSIEANGRFSGTWVQNSTTFSGTFSGQRIEGPVDPGAAISNIYIPTSSGKTWTYKNTDSDGTTYTQVATIIQSSSNNFVKRYNDSNRTIYTDTYYSGSGNSIKFYQGKVINKSDNSVLSTSTYFPAAIVFPSSLEIGTSESVTSKITTNSHPTPTDTLVRTVAIIGTETVTVPAGTYQALKVNVVVTMTSLSSTFNYVYWYVNGIGQIKMQYYNSLTPSLISSSVLISTT
jgi:hypothetical protein